MFINLKNTVSEVDLPDFEDAVYVLGLVRAGIAGDRSSGGLLSASCNLQLLYAEDPKLPSTHCFIDESPTDRVRRARGAHLHR
jgi:hypothetical protein